MALWLVTKLITVRLKKCSTENEWGGGGGGGFSSPTPRIWFLFKSMNEQLDQIIYRWVHLESRRHANFITSLLRNKCIHQKTVPACRTTKVNALKLIASLNNVLWSSRHAIPAPASSCTSNASCQGITDISQGTRAHQL
jgi:hypothetical protein